MGSEKDPSCARLEIGSTQVMAEDELFALALSLALPTATDHEAMIPSTRTMGNDSCEDMNNECGQQRQLSRNQLCTSGLFSKPVKTIGALRSIYSKQTMHSSLLWLYVHDSPFDNLSSASRLTSNLTRSHLHGPFDWTWNLDLNSLIFIHSIS